MIHARIRKRFAPGREPGGFTLDVDFRAQAGVTVLFGPSGAGKTLTLEAIAGFAAPDEGRILLDDAILFDGAARVSLPPRKRNCGYVFQNYALFPHMTLRRNLEFAAVRWRGIERHRRVGEMLERFRLADVAGRRPHELSGGQKQRCSIARALIGEPRLLLLDEPARGLDLLLREDLYAALRQVRDEFSTPTLLVTHDLEECFTIGDEMIVFREGRIVQTGPPRQVFERPASLEVARLLARYNSLNVEIRALDPQNKSSRIVFAETELEGVYYPGHFRGDRITVCPRPAELLAFPSNGRRGPNQVPAALLRATEFPDAFRLEFEGGLTVDVPLSRLPRAEWDRARKQREWTVEFPPQSLRIL